MSNCIICGSEFYNTPLLIFKNMPKSAQYMPRYDEIKSDKTIDLVVEQCQNCSLVQLNNSPVEYYREVIRASGVSESMRKFRKKQFSEFIDSYGLRGKKIIEIACGGGEYLDVLNELECNASGIEFNHRLYNQCISKGLVVAHEYVENEDTILNSGKHDGFIMLNYLEHSPNPNALLRGIRKNLSENAYGIIEVPNFDMILEKNLFSEFVIDHLTYFTKQTLQFVLSYNGFELVKFEENWDDYVITAVVKVAKKNNISQFVECQQKLLKELSNFIDNYPQKTVAVWGAGHQALMLLALLNRSDSINCVIDSAEFKQGRYTQATHIPIVHPNIINENKIRAIVIIAGGYNSEIASIIKERYPHVDIAVLEKTRLIKK